MEPLSSVSLRNKNDFMIPHTLRLLVNSVFCILSAVEEKSAPISSLRDISLDQPEGEILRVTLSNKHTISPFSLLNSSRDEEQCP